MGPKHLTRRRMLVVVVLTAGLLAIGLPMVSGEAQADSSRAALDRARSMMVKDPGGALSLSESVIAQSKAAYPGSRDTVEAAWLKSQALSRMGRTREALEYIDPVITNYRNIDPKSDLMAELLFTRAGIHRILGNLSKGTIDVQNSLKIFSENDNLNGQSKSFIVLGSIYSSAGEFKRAKNYYDQAISAGVEEPYTAYALYNNIAGLARNQGDYILSSSYYRKALEISLSNKFPSYIEAAVLTNLASTEILSKNLLSARNYISQANTIRSKIPQYDRRFIDLVLGQYDYARGDYRSSSRYFDIVFRDIDIDITGPQFKFFHEIASDIYARVGRYDLALRHHRAFKRLDDEARELMVNTNSALMAAQFDFANQDLKIARLQAEQLKKDSELAQTRNRIVLILLGGSVLLVGLLGYNFLSLRRSSRKIEAANDRLNTANETLERALKAKSEFLATTSHEIRTPLNGILGVTQVLLADDRVSPEIRDRVKLMHGAGETMRALVNDILDAAKIESGTLIIEKGDTDLGALLDDAVHLWTGRAEEKGLGLQIDRAQAPTRIVEDGPRLRQIVFNLLSNAIKFTETGSVSLTAAAEPFGAGERLVIRVADTGIGIPADRVDDIFESFKQVDGGVTRRFGGTGLGLSISRDLAEAMGGTLGVESELGRGSVFTLVLPLERPATLAEAGSAGDGLRNDVFLIIEANPLTQSVLKSALSPLGLSADISGSLDAAIARLSAGGVVCALVDAALLGADDPGRLAAVSRLAGTGDFHLAVTWPSPSEEMVRALIAAGATQVIAKPISAGGLVAALKQGLETAA